MVTAALILGGASASWARQKPAPSTNWRCQVVFRDAALDAIKSDTAPGSTSWPRPYRDGADGVTCHIIVAEGGSHDRWLWLKVVPPRRSANPRFIQFVGQTYPQLSGGTASYTTFANGEEGTFEVKGLATIEWNPNAPTRDVMPFRAYLRHPQFAFGLATLNGDSNFTGGIPSDTTSSVFVQPLDACSWQVTSAPEEPFFEGVFGERTSTRTNPRVMRIVEGNKSGTVRGEFPMPFQVTVSIIGNKAGCPLP